MKDLDLPSGGILFLFGLGICVKSLGYPLGSLRAPGAGLFPLLASIPLMIFSGVLVIHSLLKKENKANVSKASFFSAREAPKRILLGFVSLVAFRYLFAVIGFAPSAFCFILFLVRFLGHYSWKVSLLFSVLTALVAYYLFQVWLMIQMPRGIFGI